MRSTAVKTDDGQSRSAGAVRPRPFTAPRRALVSPAPVPAVDPDPRPVAVRQRKLRELVDASPGLDAQRTLQARVDAGLHPRAHPPRMARVAGRPALPSAVVQRRGETITLNDDIELQMDGEEKGSLQWEETEAENYVINGVEGKVMVLVGITAFIEGMGFGSAMMVRFASLAQKKGHEKVYAHGVLSSAEGFYEKMGMAPVPGDTFYNWVGDTATVLAAATASWEKKKAANDFK